MRITPVIFVGSLAAIAATAAPALAKNSQTTRTDGQTEEQPSSSSPCRAYQQAADGTWKELPCQGQGQTAAATRRQQSVTTTPSSAAR
ncbi:hypothetical protein SSBR45G_00570 [Bradyrhizobium sp. SSBR45G]|uniref:hypothetical protein n=1 Tax=unclassified Bradyrhizobium TaxID=2631580 RepID=UPI002342941C|nr:MULTISPECIES: hypothetical protein [unclassified Bradyrhizobium]GLH75149.1 hypothetical protein SSBR45G_00570 [Bradyrhizobium sp. SSBR45G]GLH83064.1 hypothetical protein SSBR45R_05240 [Bradyrhizobium sp. SSBR45R]